MAERSETRCGKIVSSCRHFDYFGKTLSVPQTQGKGGRQPAAEKDYDLRCMASPCLQVKKLNRRHFDIWLDQIGS